MERFPSATLTFLVRGVNVQCLLLHQSIKRWRFMSCGCCWQVPTCKTAISSGLGVGSPRCVNHLGFIILFSV